MDAIDTWYEWIFVYMREGSRWVFLAASLVLMYKRPSILHGVLVGGIALYICGAEMMLSASQAASEARQIRSNLAPSEQAWLIGDAMSSFGVFISSACLAIMSLKCQRNL